MRSVVGVTAILFNVTELGVTYLKVLWEKGLGAAVNSVGSTCSIILATISFRVDMLFYKVLTA